MRELGHVIARAVILTDGRRLPLGQAMALARPRAGHALSNTASNTTSLAPVLTDAEMRRLERENIQRAIHRASGRIYGRAGAAELLGLEPTTLTYRMKALGIPRPRT